MTHLSGNLYSVLVSFFVMGSVPLYILNICVRRVLIRGTFQNLTGRGWRVEVRRKLDIVPLNLWCRKLALTIGMRCGRGFASHMTPLIEHANHPTIISQTSLDRKAYIACRLCWATEKRVGFWVISFYAMIGMRTCNHVCPFHLDFIRVMNGRRQVR